MKIKKELKNATFEWEEESKTFSFTDSNNNKITLNKVYGFALMRFILRIAQKNFAKNKIAKKQAEELIEITEEQYEDPRQQKFNF